MPAIQWHDLTHRNSPAPVCKLAPAGVPPQPSLYEVLEVSSHASSEVIKAAYRALMEKYHPDKHPEQRRSWAEEMSRKLNHAYSVLSNPQQRSVYDHANGIRRNG
jgi:DnaJ-class molecular chaperone